MRIRNKKRSNKASSSTSTRKRSRRSQDVELTPPSSIDEAFHLSLAKIKEVVGIICSLRTLSEEELMLLDEYARSFYSKLLRCFREDGNRPLVRFTILLERSAQPITEEISSEEEERSQPITEEISSEEEESDVEIGFSRPLLEGPFEFGSYSPGTEPDRIPYHLYLLVKEAVDIMKRSEWHNKLSDLTDLERVEEKIYFFCRYFHSHLPAGWEYIREHASTDVANYDPTRMPRYNMGGYTPISSIKGGGPFVEFEFDEATDLSRREMIGVMGIIHSRKTPAIWKMFPLEISFYCRLCSCFGIDYHCLEAASEDDVCLMNVGSV